MKKNRIWRRAIRLGAVLLLIVLLLPGCSARKWIGSTEADTACFEGEFLQRVPNGGDAASIGELDPAHVTTVQFAFGLFEDTRATLRGEAEITELLDFLTGAEFTRLYGPGDEWGEENEHYGQVNRIMSSGLVIHYTVDFRQTMGAFYVSPEGQAVWFTGDEQAVLMSEPGSVDYESLASWMVSYRYDVDLGSLTTGAVTGGD